MRLFLLAMLAACLPQAQGQSQAQAQSRPSGCREDIPECSAACALRETSRPRFTEWYDQKCAAALLGKSPEGVAETATSRPVDLLDTR
jgi:hypothetical protein